jgi:CDP-4-dehydro-6-deoxyglucose reductase, E1
MTYRYWRYPTAFESLGDEELDAMHRVIDSRRLTMGEEVKAFEEEFATRHGMRHGIMVNSGSSANLIAVAALFNKPDRPLRRGDKVIVPALAWSTTYAPLVQHGLDLILADCDETWNAPVLPHVGGEPVRLVVGCSILGNPGYLASWRNWAEAEDAYFIEDNCESLGAAMDGKLCGTFGLMSTFSFFWSHQICGGEGGMVLTNDDGLARVCRQLRSHGWTRDVDEPTSFDDEYRFELFGYNVRPLEITAAMARVQLRKLNDFISQRQHNQALFRLLTGASYIPVIHQTLIGEHQSPFGFAFSVETPWRRQELVHALRSGGIDCRLPTGGSFRLHPYGRQWARQETPIADEIHNRGMFLGNAPFPIEEEITAAVDIMSEVL